MFSESGKVSVTSPVTYSSLIVTLAFLTSFPDGDADPEPPFGNCRSRRIVIFFVVVVLKTSIFLTSVYFEAVSNLLKGVAKYTEFQCAFYSDFQRLTFQRNHLRTTLLYLTNS